MALTRSGTRSTLGRRSLLFGAIALAACKERNPLQGGVDYTSVDLARDFGNFRAVYGVPAQRAAFRDFLRNVFHLYPDSELDALIASLATGAAADGDVYRAIERDLPSITPFLSSVRYALPALVKQKQEMAEQTQRLLGDVNVIHGYLEIGTHGRYLDELQKRVSVVGPTFTTAPVSAGYGVIDIIDRGRVSLAGTVVPWNDYAGFEASGIETASLDLATIYIGLHHATEAARAPYVSQLRDLLSPGGRVVIRDHDVNSAEMRAMVGLAHDVFNVGTEEPWLVNAAERRNFYPLEYLVSLFESHGFRAMPARLRQEGDPTLNTLLCFQKV